MFSNPTPHDYLIVLHQNNKGEKANHCNEHRKEQRFYLKFDVLVVRKICFIDLKGLYGYRALTVQFN